MFEFKKKAWTGLDTQEYKKQYYEENKKQIKEYREENKEQIKEQRKQYREENKEQIKEKNKNYYNENKEKYNIEMKCCCGSTYVGLCNKRRHETSKKHLSWLKDNIQTAETI